MKRVLVVDDEIVLAQVIGEFLQDEGYAVLLAHMSQGVLELLETERPDMMFLDVMMPDGDGRDIVKEMQSHPELQDIPVVMMTGVSDEAAMRKAMHAGANSYNAEFVTYRLPADAIRQ